MNSRILSISAAFIIAAHLTAGNFASAAIETFDTPVVTSATQAPGVWYTDRYAPAGFSSPVSFGGDNRLQQTISAADGANSRPGSFNSSFYNTQGRKFDLAAGTTSIQIDLYIPGYYQNTVSRMAGFWGTAFDGTGYTNGDITAYPIIEFTSDGSDPRFRGWDNATGLFTDMGLPTGFAYDTWQTLVIDLVGSNFVYTVGDLVLSTSAEGSASIGNTILQGHNTTGGINYTIYWDNLANTGVVPEPATILVWTGIATCAGLAYLRKQRSA